MKGVLAAIGVIVAIKFGIEYLYSPKFQEFGDKSKAPWTCQVNNLMGHLYMVTSDYDKAIPLFRKTAERCPESSMCEVAEFEIAESLSKSGQGREAYNAYKSFIEKYKGSKRAKIAQRASEIVE